MSKRVDISKNENKKFHVRLRLHYTWIFAFIFIVGIVYTQFPESYTFYRRILLGVVASLIFLLVIIIRQLVLNYIAGWRNVIFRRVTIYVFGGVPGTVREYTTPTLEILLGSAGLVFSLLFTIILYAVYTVFVIVGDTLFGSLMAWLSFLLFLFTCFHFIPAYPLDGGRILRALIWRTTRNYDRATLISARVGQGAGVACIVGGLVTLGINQELVSGITLVIVGWALTAAASRTVKNTMLTRSLKDITVMDMMSRQYPQVSPQMSVAKIIREYSLVSGQYYFLVVAEDKLLGSVGLRDLKSVLRRSRERTRVDRILTPARYILTAYVNQSAADAYEQMAEMEFEQMPVMEDGKVVGVVFQDKLHRIAMIRTTFRM